MAILNDALNYFAKTETTPGDWWAFDDDQIGLGLHHQGDDGSLFYLDLDRDDKIIIVWRAPGTEKMQSATFKRV